MSYSVVLISIRTVQIFAEAHRNNKNLWRRKCVRGAIFRTIEVRVEGRFVPCNPYFVCYTVIGSLCNLYGVPLPKKLTERFYQLLMKKKKKNTNGKSQLV